MKILILGSEGFIGSNCRNYFNGKGYEVYCADVIIKDDPRYILINDDCEVYKNIFSKYQFDVCINASGAANVQLSFKLPHSDFCLNSVNVFSILDAIRLFNPTCAFINMSSAAVYGNSKSLPISEKSLLMPNSPYGFHKLYSEQICSEFYNYFGIKTLSLRIFSAYGPGLRKQIFWDLYKKARESNDSITIFGTGKETRDFIYIQDLVCAIDCLISNNYFNGGAINIASGKAISIKDVAYEFLKFYNPLLKLNFSGLPLQGAPMFWEADISLLKSFNFQVNYTIYNGLKETIKWLKEQD